LGINLLPTYTYCRLYENGEVLKRHTDRPSCEISGTLTIDYDPDSQIWPIFFSEDDKDTVGQRIDIDVGDMVMYRGNDLTHWRPEYKGKWQIQVFFHYVNADGKNSEWAFDKRDIKIDTVNSNNTIKADKSNNVLIIDDGDDTFPGLATFHENFKPELMFTKEESDSIVKMAKEMYSNKAKVGTDKNAKFLNEVRRVDNYCIELNSNTKWIFEKIVKAVSTANKEYYNFDLLGITHELQLLHYKSEESAFYDWHIDIGNGHASKRKLSVIAMLSDPKDYEGGKLIIDNGNKTECINSKGSISMFPSYTLHTVTPVTKGERWVLVVWIHGSQRFK
jgi:PKHD-type hydroxylase